MTAAAKKQKEPITTMVFPANVSAIWEQAAGLLQPAVDLVGTHDIEDVRKMILCGSAQLWVGWNSSSKHIQWTVVSEIVNYPRGSWLRVWLAGSKPGQKTDWSAAEKATIDFAIDNECVGIEELAREGWARRHDDFCNTSKGLRLFRHNFKRGHNV